MKDSVAAELEGVRCRLAKVGGSGALLAHHECVLADNSVEDLRGFRRTHQVPVPLRVILWPRHDDAGVTPISAKPGEPLRRPKTLTIRQRVEPLVKAGFRVNDVSMPHQVLAEFAAQMGAGLAVCAAFHASGGCLTFARQGRSSHRPAYLKWDTAWAADTAGSGDELARYEFAAALVPHVRHLLDAVPGVKLRVLVCGTLANLRPAMGPVSEEFGSAVEVMDHPWEGLLDSPIGLHGGAAGVEPAHWQLVRAAAIGSGTAPGAP